MNIDIWHSFSKKADRSKCNADWIDVDYEAKLREFFELFQDLCEEVDKDAVDWYGNVSNELPAHISWLIEAGKKIHWLNNAHNGLWRKLHGDNFSVTHSPLSLKEYEEIMDEYFRCRDE